MTTLRRVVPECFEPLLQHARYKGAWGGRYGAKSHFFAEQLVEDALYFPGLLSVCVREVQKSLAQSSKRLIESKLSLFGLGEADGFKVFREVIETPRDGIIIFTGMQDHTAESIKSLEGFHRGWWDEAQKASGTSLRIYRPTFFRVPNCELWFSWNPKLAPPKDHAEDTIDGLLRGPHPPPGTICVEAQFTDNPWFAGSEDGSILPNLDFIMEEEYDRERRSPEDYAHIWKGAYLTHSEARVFHNWQVRDFDTPPNALFHFGGDFGFAVDPSVLIRCFRGRMNDDGTITPDETGRDLFIDREAYRVHCDIDFTPALYAGSCPYAEGDTRRWENPYGDVGIPGALQYPIIADSARPETISHLVRRGFRVQGAKKGAGSVEDGVEFLKNFRIFIHPSCTHAADEFLLYSFKTDRYSGAVLPILDDKKNHVIDSCRYAVEDMRRAKGFFG